METSMEYARRRSMEPRREPTEKELASIKMPGTLSKCFGPALALTMAAAPFLGIAWLSTQDGRSPLERQWDAERNAPGWHVVSGELFHDGVRDDAGTRRMQGEIAKLVRQEAEADMRLSEWAADMVARRRQALTAAAMQDHTAVYNRYRNGRP